LTIFGIPIDSVTARLLMSREQITDPHKLHEFLIRLVELWQLLDKPDMAILVQEFMRALHQNRPPKAISFGDSSCGCRFPA
jgi:hypothetical protein